MKGILVLITALIPLFSCGPVQLEDRVKSDKIKVIYFYFLGHGRSVQEIEFVPYYKVVYSASWKREMGSKLDDPLITGFKNLNPYVGDGRDDNGQQGVGARWFANKILSSGFLDLPSTDLKKLTPEYLKSVATNKDIALYFRLIWVMTDKISKPVLFYDIASNKAHCDKFLGAEKTVDMYMSAYTVLSTIR